MLNISLPVKYRELFYNLMYEILGESATGVFCKQVPPFKDSSHV